MKNLKKQIAAGVLAFSLLSASGMAMATGTNLGSAAALADPSYTLEEMLEYAIQDEYAAQAEYQAIQDEFGTVRIYTNIMKAEAKHIEALLPLFETYEITVPADTASEQVVIPADLATSYDIGVEAEVKNIAMYEAFLKEDLPEDVRFVFENLKKASESHLAAFQRATDGNLGGGFVQSRQGNSSAQGQQMGNGVANAQGQAMNTRGNTVAPRQQVANNNMICR